MAYSSLADLLKEFSATDLARYTGDSTGNVINIERVEHAIEMADSIIDSYLAGRYSLPFDERIQKLLLKISLDLTIYNIFEYNFPKISLPNTIQWRKANAMKLLDDIKNGKLKIEDYDFIKFKSNNKVYSDDLLDDFADLYI